MQKNILRRMEYFSVGGILAGMVLSGTVSVSNEGKEYVAPAEQTTASVLSETSTPSATPIIQKVAAKQVTKPVPTHTSPQSSEAIQPTPTLIPPTSAVTISEIQTTPYDAWFDQYSTVYNVDRQTLVKIARCESGFNPHAKNGPYDGMYQFHAGTWHSTRTAMGENPDVHLRNNPEESIKTAAWKIAHGGIGAWPVCGK
ncbi:MAG: transglycosylase SLT domain-containing protein [Candidatus Roizmanbacteria bacterium]|nr:transglycosylase SLT domain-containing protein [Candidatus Roizmanbacteria bacterium]